MRLARLGSVEARQKVGVAAFQLRHELLWQLKLDLGVVCFSESTEEFSETKGRAIFHNHRSGGVAELLRLIERIFNLSQPVDQLLVERFLAGENSAVGNAVAQTFRRQIPLF